MVSFIRDRGMEADFRDYCGGWPCRVASLDGDGGWQPIETAPRDGTHFLATAIVRNVKTDARWWETYVIWADDETGEIHPDCDHGWSSIDDYSHWMPLPAPPDAALKGEGE
ncbi:DUF551 domain-containing protein [Sphingobium sp. WCS2017Hpa-17]|uniref:DUF551 domain-containing protein n=1 Tax=Sphingobium sp. WCS2017Hpa-17 TaxID=3073638 RepID=UPI00288BEA18|nr:DUF551 domain-containing protein [Sphingobium sp. WCS2017Hpa-17]